MILAYTVGLLSVGGAGVYVATKAIETIVNVLQRPQVQAAIASIYYAHFTETDAQLNAAANRLNQYVLY
jgi:hypothetical protein